MYGNFAGNDDDERPDPTRNLNSQIAQPLQTTQAAANPLANMAGAASPDIASPFNSVFGDGGNPAGGGPSQTSPTAPLRGQATPAPAQTLAGAGWSALAGVPPPAPTPAPASTPSPPTSPTSPPPPPPNQPSSSRERKGGGELTDHFTNLASQVATATDPQQQAVLKDQLARNVYGALADAGHDVKWEGEQLVVDGRKYIVGAGKAAPVSGGGNPDAMTNAFAGGEAIPLDTSYDTSGDVFDPAREAGAIEPGGFAGDQAWAGQGGGDVFDPARQAGAIEEGGITGGQGAQDARAQNAAPAGVRDFSRLTGYDQGKFDANKDDGKYQVGGALSQHDPRLGITPDVLKSLNALGYGTYSGSGQKLSLTGLTDKGRAAGIQGDFRDADYVVGFSGGDGKWGYVDPVQESRDAAKGGAGGGSAYDRVFGASAEGAHGVDVHGVDPHNPHAPPPPPPTEPTSRPPPPPPPAPPTAPAGPTAPTYTAPGAMDNSDLEGFGVDDIMQRLGPTPQFEGFGDLGDLGGGPTDDATQDLVMQMLQHPESMDPRTVDMLKAKSKDELADMARSDDENLLAGGYANGIQDSNWLASERNARRGERDRSLVENNRNIDMNAAATNMADRRAAAAAGQSFTESKNTRNLANRGQRFQEAQQKIANQFKSTEEHRAAVQLASDTSLRAAAMKNDRRGLEEGFKQKAAELGLSAEKIRTDYLLGLMDNATRTHGIDVGAAVDREKLSQAGREFQQDMIFRIMSLEQQDRQFGANYGLDLTHLQSDMDDSAFKRAFG